MLFWGRKKQAPQTDQEILEDAFADIAQQQRRRSTRKRRQAKWRKYVDRRVLVALALIFVVLIADAVRRENMEFYATVTQVAGQVQVRLVKGGSDMPGEVGQKLEDGGEVRTGPSGGVALSFPDGSVVTLAPASVFTVRLLEYHRGGRWRSRAFMLGAGRMWARVSEKFGRDSRCKVHTPSSVAAVRGTRFSVAYDAAANTTDIACSDGAVQVNGFTGDRTQIGRDMVTNVPYGRGPAPRAAIDPTTRSYFAQPPLQQEIKPDPWLKRFELKLTSALDLPLSILGIGKSSWAVGAADFARRTNALEALRYIHQSIEGYETYPDFVDPFTLKELGFPREDAERILWNFDGGCIESYRRTGQGFLMYARARDRKRTPYQLTVFGPERITEIPGQAD